MPYDWVNPDKFLKHRGISVYHTYKEDDYCKRCEYWYTTDINTTESNDDCVFDVRDLPKTREDENIYETIKNAIEKKLLKLPEGDEYEDG